MHGNRFVKGNLYNMVFSAWRQREKEKGIGSCGCMFGARRKLPRSDFFVI
jgi:hypothetical protein